MTIRECTDADVEEVLDLLPQLWPDAPLDRGLLTRAFRNAIRSPHQSYICAEVDGRVVGFLSLSVDFSLWCRGSLARIDELVVDAGVRGMGVGTGLLERAAEIAVGLGCGRIALDSARHRVDAHRLYMRMGFENRADMYSRPLASPGNANDEPRDSTTVIRVGSRAVHFGTL